MRCHYRKKRENKQNSNVLVENTPVDSIMVTTDDEAVPLHTNGQLTEHILDSGHYGSNGVLEQLDHSATKL